MIKWIFIMCCISVSLNLFAQNRKNGREMKLKSVSTSQSEIKNGTLEPGRKSEMKYDKQGNIITDLEQNTTGSYRNYDTYVFDKHNQEIEHIERDEKGRVIRKTVSEYNNLENKTMEQVYDSTQLIEKVVFQYNSFDQKSEEITYLPNGDLKKKTLFTYDKYGSLLERNSYNAAGILTYSKKYIYEYYK